MTAGDFLSALAGTFWPTFALPVALLVLCFCGGLIVARGRKTKEATRQILGAFLAVAGLYLADARTALPLSVCLLALLCGLLAGHEWVPARVRAQERRRMGRPHA